MDERLRKLERQFYANQLDTSALYALQQRFVSTWGQCPEEFVIKRIQDQYQAYLDFLRASHAETAASLTKIFKDVTGKTPGANWKAFSTDYLSNFHPFRLSITQSIAHSSQFPPLLIIRAGLTISSVQMPETVRADWLQRRTQAAEHLRNIYAATFSQCGYTECVQIITEDQEETVVVAVAVPRPLIQENETSSLITLADQIGDLPSILSNIETMYRNHFRQPLLAVKSCVYLNTLRLGTERPYRYDDYDYSEIVGPGALRTWLMDQNLHDGYLILAGVTRSAFITQSGNAYGDQSRARQLYDEMAEVDHAFLAEMIYYYSPQSKTLRIVPVGTQYTKECIFLRLIAEI